jgi:hypothetical protein
MKKTQTTDIRPQTGDILGTVHIERIDLLRLLAAAAYSPNVPQELWDRMMRKLEAKTS